jgi:hypothetical protein
LWLTGIMVAVRGISPVVPTECSNYPLYYNHTIIISQVPASVKNIPKIFVALPYERLVAAKVTVSATRFMRPWGATRVRAGLSIRPGRFESHALHSIRTGRRPVIW